MYYTLRQTFKKLVFNDISKKCNGRADLPPRPLCNSCSPDQLGLRKKLPDPPSIKGSTCQTISSNRWPTTLPPLLVISFYGPFPLIPLVWIKLRFQSIGPLGQCFL